MLVFKEGVASGPLTLFFLGIPLSVLAPGAGK